MHTKNTTSPNPSVERYAFAKTKLIQIAVGCCDMCKIVFPKRIASEQYMAFFLLYIHHISPFSFRHHTPLSPQTSKIGFVKKRSASHTESLAPVHSAKQNPLQVHQLELQLSRQSCWSQSTTLHWRLLNRTQDSWVLRCAWMGTLHIMLTPVPLY